VQFRIKGEIDEAAVRRDGQRRGKDTRQSTSPVSGMTVIAPFPELRQLV
jgi:hypothetical protein